VDYHFLQKKQQSQTCVFSSQLLLRFPFQENDKDIHPSLLVNTSGALPKGFTEETSGTLPPHAWWLEMGWG